MSPRSSVLIKPVVISFSVATVIKSRSWSLCGFLHLSPLRVSALFFRFSHFSLLELTCSALAPQTQLRYCYFRLSFITACWKKCWRRVVRSERWRGRWYYGLWSQWEQVSRSTCWAQTHLTLSHTSCLLFFLLTQINASQETSPQRFFTSFLFLTFWLLVYPATVLYI
jgi:hypothetical protein